ncbi:MAG: hypothetical protein V4721_17050, partial [Bacteroidota bacterium]
VILNIIGNVISGQVTGDTAKQLSERFGKIQQSRQSISINSSDTSVSRSTQLDFAIPAAKISTLSSGEFVGMVADDPQTRIELKVFHNEIVNNHTAIRDEERQFKSIPKIRTIDSDLIEVNYYQIKQDIQELIASELGSNNHDLPTTQPSGNSGSSGKMKNLQL